MFATARWGWMLALGASVLIASCGGRAAGHGEKLPTANGGVGDDGSSTASGGVAGDATAPGIACNTALACGGDVVGNWVVEGSCLDVRGDADVGTLLGVGCATAPMRGMLEVSGSFVVGADGSVRDETTTSGAIEVSLSPQCLLVSGTVVACDSVSRAFGPVQGNGTTCTDAGAACTCRLEVDQKGSMGHVSFAPSPLGVASTDGTRLNVEGDTVGDYDYCAEGDKLAVTPRGGGLALNTAGSIELSRQRGAK